MTKRVLMGWGKPGECESARQWLGTQRRSTRLRGETIGAGVLVVRRRADRGDAGVGRETPESLGGLVSRRVLGTWGGRSALRQGQSGAEWLGSMHWNGVHAYVCAGRLGGGGGAQDGSCGRRGACIALVWGSMATDVCRGRSLPSRVAAGVVWLCRDPTPGSADMVRKT